MSKYSVLGLLISLCSLTGCVENYSLFIDSAIAPSGDDCTVDVANPRLSGGSFDSTPGARDYRLSLVVTNQLRRNRTSAMADPNIIILEEAEVSLQNAAGDRIALTGVPNPYAVPMTASISSTAGTQPTQGLVSFSPISRATMEGLVNGRFVYDQLGGAIRIGIRVRGRTHGGRDVRSDEFLYPITFCEGCMATSDSKNTGISTCRGGQDGGLYFQAATP